ncbi:MAG: hypothetical protein ACHQEM_11235 [Chitinophagales bacterium]
MKNLIIASVMIVSGFAVTNANAQGFVGVKIGWAAPPVPVFVAPPRIVYPAHVPYYRVPAPFCPPVYRNHYQRNCEERYWQRHRRW